MLADETTTSINFITGFIENGIHLDLFVDELCKAWEGFWNYIAKKSVYTDERKTQYFKLIFEYANLENIKNIAKSSDLVQRLAKGEEAFDLNMPIEKLKNIIEEFKVKFVSINYEITPSEIFEFICQENYYEISIETIKNILKFKQHFEQVDFDTQNFYSIINSGYKPLVDYINADIATYIDNVYLKLPDNKNETAEVLLQLLNNKTIPLDKKTLIIQKVVTKLSVVDNVNDIEVKRIIVDESKVEPTWTTIIQLFSEENKKITDEILAFISIDENAKIISKTKINKEIPDKETVSSFIDMLLVNDELSDEIYKLLTKSVPY